MLQMIIYDSVGGMESEKWIGSLLESEKNLGTVCIQDLVGPFIQFEVCSTFKWQSYAHIILSRQ